MISGQDIANTALQWLGAPFKHQGRNRHGIDCIGVVVEVCRDLGLRAPDGSLLVDHDVSGYSREPAQGLLESMLNALLVPVQEGQLYQPGDVLLFRFARWPQHCGIVTSISEGQGAGTGRSREPPASEATPIAEVRRPEQGQQIMFAHAYQPAGRVIVSRLDNRWERLLRGVYRFASQQKEIC